jgi:MFS family permease
MAERRNGEVRDPAQGEPSVLSRQLVLSLYVPAIILALGNGIALPAIPVYARSFDVSFGVASMVLVATGLGSLVAGLPTGYLLDRVGRRKVVLAGPILAAAASFLTVTAQSFPELLAYRFVSGVAMQLWMLGRLAIITDTGGGGQRGRQITSMHAMDSVGRIAGPLVGGLIATAWDVRIPFIVHGILCLVAVVPSFLLIKETAPRLVNWGQQQTATALEQPKPGYGWLLAFPILVFLAAQFLGSVTRGALNNGALDLYAVYHYNVNAATIGALGTAATVIGIPITVGAGAVMDRFGRKATIIPGFTLLGIALAFQALTAFNDWPFPAYIVAYLIVQGANMVTTGNMQVLGTDIAPVHARGSFFGVSQTIVQVGQILSPTAFAFLTENASAAAGFLFLGLASLGVVVLIGVLIQDPVRARRTREPETIAPSPS